MNTKFRYSSRRGQGRQGNGPRRLSNTIASRPAPPCGICSRSIRDIASALALPSDGAAVHFDCALKQAETDLKPGDGETVIYLGKGVFAAVDAAAYRNRRLKIIRSQDWESSDGVCEWRKQLRVEI